MTNKGFSILLLFTLVFGGALGAAFAAGVALGKSQGPDPSQETALFRTPRSAQNGGSRPDGFRGGESRLGVEGGVREGGFPRRSDDHASTTDGGSNADGGQGFFGSIASLQDGVMTVDSPQFGQMLAIISEGTAVQKTAAGSVDDLVVGIDVRIQGRRVEDGPVQARTITLVTDASEGFSGPDGGGRRGFSGGLSMSGTIERIEEGLMTVATADGTSQVSVDDETVIQKIEAGEMADLVEGAAVRVLGSPNEEGMLEASLVILVPDGFFRYSRRGSLDGARQPQ